MASVGKKTASKRDLEHEIPIVRDATFTRVTADQALVVNLGREYELAFLQNSPQIKTMTIVLQDEGGMSGFERDSVMTEVVRVCISSDGAAQMAMHILQSLIRANQVINEMVLKSVQEMIEEAKSEMNE